MPPAQLLSPQRNRAPPTSTPHSHLPTSLCLSFPGTISRNSRPALEQSHITARSYLTGNEIGGPRVLRAEIPCIKGRGEDGRDGDKFSHHTFSLQPTYKPKAHPTGVPISTTISCRSWRPSRNRGPSRSDRYFQYPDLHPVRASDSYSCFLCLLLMLSCQLDSGRTEGAHGLPVPLEARKNQWACVCWGFPAPAAVVFAIEEVPFEMEGYDDDVDGSRVKDDMEVFGRRVRSGWS